MGRATLGASRAPASHGRWRGGLALIVGAFVALVSIPLIGSMIGAMLTVNIHYGFSAVNTTGLTTSGPLFGRRAMRSTSSTSPAW